MDKTNNNKKVNERHFKIFTPTNGNEQTMNKLKEHCEHH